VPSLRCITGSNQLQPDFRIRWKYRFVGGRWPTHQSAVEGTGIQRKSRFMIQAVLGRTCGLAVPGTDHRGSNYSIWTTVYTVVSIAILASGLSPDGVGAGTLAAAFQSCMYGAFTPAGGLFASLTSMAMLGTLMPWAAVTSGVLATLVAGIVWGFGVGRRLYARVVDLLLRL
ncbi:hypothetical protein CCUS01_11264, partial [Colletotrichum cuscutae]